MQYKHEIERMPNGGLLLSYPRLTKNLGSTRGSDSSWDDDNWCDKRERDREEYVSFHDQTSPESYWTEELFAKILDKLKELILY